HMVKLPDGREVPAHTVLLTALETDSDVNVLSAPNIITTDNEEAEIVVGRNVPFVASRATSATNLQNLFTTIERHDVGIMLRMTPQITADDFVHLTLFEEVSDIDPTSVGDPTQVGPTTTVRTASTAVAARNGQTVVIGGLLSDTLRQDERAVPYLNKIPVLAALGAAETAAFTRALADAAALPYAPVLAALPAAELIDALPLPYARRHVVLPLARNADGVEVAIGDPGALAPLDDLRLLYGGRIVAVVVPPPALRASR